MPATDKPHVAVVGAGIIGLSTALTLADRGCRVTVYDPDPASGASHHAGGMLAPASEVVYQQDPLFPLMRHSAARYPELIALCGKYSDLPTGYRTEGTLVVARDRADRDDLDDLLAYQTQIGMTAARITTRQARTLEPALSPAISAVVASEGDHQVQPRLFTRALIDACTKAGVEFIQRRIDDISSLEEDQVLLSAGLGVAEIGGWFDHSPPLKLRPVYGDILQLGVPAHLDPLVTHVIRGVVEGRPIYIIPRGDGTLTVGATSREDGRDTPQAQGVHQLLRDAIEILPGIEDCDFIEASAGARPGTPDDLPYLGRVSERVVISTGYFRHGILLAALAAQCGAGLVDTHEPHDPCPVNLDACHPLRHAS